MARCDNCLLHQAQCLCAVRPAAAGKVAVCLLYYQGEIFKPSNSGRLVADVLSDNHAFQWTRSAPAPALNALLCNPSYAPVLVFPTQYAEPQRCLGSGSTGHLDFTRPLDEFMAQTQNQGRKPLMVLLDGSWREARKMFRCSWLASLPVLGIEPQAESRYGLREAVHEYQLSTAEVAIEVLRLLGDGEQAQVLSDYFDIFKHRSLQGRSNHHKGVTVRP